MVEKVEMKDLFIIKNGYTPSKNHPEYWEGGTIPWFRMEDIRQNGRILNDSIQHITPLGVKKSGLFPANSIIVATTATIGEHALVIVDSLANQRFTFLTKCKSFDSKLDMKYMHYYMFIVDEWCKKNTNVSGFASVDMEKFKRLQIPIPSLEEQNRIVGILDTFTDSIENLKQQIAQRRKQYEHYRDQLLDLEGKPGVEMKTLGEIGTFIRGTGIQKTDFVEQGCPCIHYGQIHTKYGLSADKTFSFINESLYKKSKKAIKGDVVLATTSEDAEGVAKPVAWLGNDEVAVSGDAFIYHHSQNAKFIAHLFSSHRFFLFKKMNASGAKVVRISGDKMANYEFPLPPFPEQQRIVSILDTFEASITNLEAQLAQRQKQYEYYRNQLLTFE